MLIESQVNLGKLNAAKSDWVKNTLKVTNPKYVSSVRFGNKFAARQIPKYLPGYTKNADGSYSVPRAWWLALSAAKKKEYTVKTAQHHYDFPNPYLRLLPHQEEASNAFFKLVNDNDAQGLPTDSMIVLSTSGGKTILGMMLAWHAQEKTLVVVPTKEIEEAWVEDCAKLFGISSKDIGRIRGKKIDIKGPFTVGSIQTLMNLDPALWANEFGMLVCDECHRLPGEKFIKVLERSNAHLRVGLTATDQRKDGMMPAVRWHLGQNCYKNTTPLNSVPLLYHTVPTYFNPTPIHKIGKSMLNTRVEYDYQAVMTELHNDADRDKRIVELVGAIMNKYTGDILVASQRVTHLENLKALIEKAYPDQPVALLTGVAKDRKKLYADIKAGKYKITLGTQSIVSEGASNPRWTHVISCSPFSDPKTIQQLKGRVIRIDPDNPAKKAGHYWDLLDGSAFLQRMWQTRYTAVHSHAKSRDHMALKKGKLKLDR